MSPIRPENRDRYPTDWPEISRAIKTRAGWRCECAGECGRPAGHLGPDPIEREDLPPTRCINHHGQPAWGTGSIVVLTTAHLNHTPEDCDPANLKAMCQGCHLHYDREHHAHTRAETRRAAAEAAGQGSLAGVAGSPDPPTNVTARTRGGAVIPLDGTYLGVEDGIHVWEYTIRGTIAEVHADVLPPMTALRFVRTGP